jgi:hypothetical protein
MIARRSRAGTSFSPVSLFAFKLLRELSRCFQPQKFWKLSALLQLRGKIH